MKILHSSLIEKHLNHTLTEAEQQHFNTLYATDEQFRQAITCGTPIYEAIQHEKEMMVWKDRFKTWGKNNPIEPLPIKQEALTKTPKRMRLFVASIISLLFCVSATAFILQQSKVPRRVFDTFFTASPVPFYEKPSIEVAKMLELYSTKNYLNVVKRFETLSPSQKDTLRLYKGISELASNSIHPSQAFATLQAVARLANVPKDLTQWYKALALIKTRHTEAAKIELRAIAATNSNYRGRALETLKMLE
jgi:hypothetical protein